MRSRLALAAAVAAAVALTGCAKSIDTDKAEKFIAKTVTAQVGADVKSVKCPGGLTAKKGETFECTVTGADGSSGKAEVTEKDDQGNVGLALGFVPTKRYETFIAKDIEPQVGAKVSIVCPEIVPAKKGDTFNCTATDPNKNEATVKVTQKDDKGNVNYKLQQQ